jgi:hypothetical protein
MTDKRNLNVHQQFERLYSNYIAKIKRHEDLIAAGRYGFQLRMPAKAIHIAKDALRAFGQQHNVEVESLFR